MINTTFLALCIKKQAFSRSWVDFEIWVQRYMGPCARRQITLEKRAPFFSSVEQCQTLCFHLKLKMPVLVWQVCSDTVHGAEKQGPRPPYWFIPKLHFSIVVFPLVSSPCKYRHDLLSPNSDLWWHKEVMQFSTIWFQLEDKMLSEVSQKKEDKDRMNSLICEYIE